MRRPLAAVALAAAAVGVPGAGSASAAPAGSGDFRIADDRVTESSGLALSRRHPHTVWTVNDSGDGARVFGVDTRTGRTVAVHTFDAPVRDVEALAVTRQGRLLVGDIGDNTASRELVRVFWFDEPGLGQTHGDWASWELVYPDGPHDAEALAVDPRTGRVVLVTKGESGGIYALPQRPSRLGVNRLTRVGSVPARITDAVHLADGSALAVRTYTRLLLLDPSTWSVTGSRVLPLQPQGETLALAPDGDGLLAGSEGRRSLVQRVDLPDAAQTPTTSTAPSTVPTSPAPSRTPSSLPRTSATSSAPSPGRAVPWAVGTVALVALGLAGLLVSRRTKGVP